jgi:recombinational DNA repair protein (RecF pathway)
MTTTCLDCGRPLDHPDSIARERGRVCQEKFEGDTHVTPMPRRMRRKRLSEDQVITGLDELVTPQPKGTRK